MRAAMVSVTLGILFLTAITVRADKITTDYDHSVNFSKYKTFMWINESQIDEPFMKDRIMGSINAQLINRGLRQVSDGASLAIGANLATEEKHVWETYYSGSDWGWGSGWSTTEERTYQVGTLTVDLFDTQTKKLVWQGVAIDTLSRKPEHRTKDYAKGVEKMFRDFPIFVFGETALPRAPLE
jgi:hypothetical protein